MKLIALLLILILTGCAYRGPRVDLHVGFMGAEIGVGIGGETPRALPVTQGLAK
jgi:hypothetical protein